MSPTIHEINLQTVVLQVCPLEITELGVIIAAAFSVSDNKRLRASDFHPLRRERNLFLFAAGG